MNAPSTITIAALCASLIPATANAQSRATGPAVPALVLPARRPADAPPPLPPALPPGADAVTALTLHVTVRRETAGGGVREAEQVVTRSADRVHLSLGDGHEWLFERNPVDPRRVAGARTDPASRAVVVYDESELRTHLGVRGWADVLMLGFDPAALNGAVRQQDDRAVDALRFSRFTTSVERGTRDIWWSHEHLLALSFERVDAEGRATFTVHRAGPGVDAALLRPLSSRFPGFEVVEVADLLERH